MVRALYCALVFMAVTVLAGLAHAATITQVKHPLCHLSLKGDIEKGDSKKFVAIAKSAIAGIHKRGAKEPTGDRRFMAEQETVTLCLDSKGGSYDEALAIIDLMLTAGGFATVIDQGAECYSACALIFMFGYIEAYHADKYPDRRLHVLGKLGFHAPYIQPGHANYNRDTVAHTYQAGVRAFGRLMELDRNEFLARGLVIAFMKTGPSDLLYIDTVDKAAEWTIELIGHRTPSNLTTDDVVHACDSEEIWIERRRTREWVKNKYVEKKPPKRAAIAFTSGRHLTVLQGYGEEGGEFCVVRLQKDDKGNLGLELWIEGDPEKLKEIRAQKDFRISGGRLLVEPGFTQQKPEWFLFARTTMIEKLAPTK